MTQRTSEQWWSRVKTSRALLHHWLNDQYRGEATAAERIDALRHRFATPGSRADRVLRVIASQERRHAAWVAGLLRARGLSVAIDDVPSRYWEATLGGITDLETGAAVGAHAEKMRLERIEVIARDTSAPSDIRDVFARILPQERFHERAFRSLSTTAALRATSAAHAQGRNALGLVP
ncbi:MAG: ferritin-like domain-containing protein [Myxococcota bacterium]